MTKSAYKFRWKPSCLPCWHWTFRVLGPNRCHSGSGGSGGSFRIAPNFFWTGQCWSQGSCISWPTTHHRTCKPYLSALPLFCIATWLCARSWLSILPFGASGEQLPPAKEADTGQDKRTCAANIQGKLQKPAWWVAGRSSLASICRQDRARLSGGWDTYHLGWVWRCRSKVESGWIHFFPVGCCRRGGAFANVVSLCFI